MSIYKTKTMDKNQRQSFEVLSKIIKNANTKNWTCFSPNCTLNSINSHLLQRNGVLNYITENGHLMQLKIQDLFKIEKEGYLSFKKIGINDVIAYPLFCNEHDSLIFKHIEQQHIDFFEYKTQLLFSYRALCAEIRKKQRNLDMEKAIAKSNTLQGNNAPSFFERNEQTMLGNEQGIIDLNYFKEEFELEFTNQSERFEFFTCKMPLIKISLSAIFSYAKKISGHVKVFSNPLETIFINVIPQADFLIIIVGYHKKVCDSWVIEYANSWRKCTDKNFTELLSDLIVRVETWAIAISTYKNISDFKWNKFKSFFLDSIHNDLNNDSFKENIFENIVKPNSS